MRRISFERLMAIVGLFLALVAGPALAVVPEPAVPGGIDATIVTPLTGDTLIVQPASGAPVPVTIGVPGDLALAARGQVGDRLTGTINDVRETPGQRIILTKLQSIARPLADGPRIFAFALAAALLLAAAALACAGKPQALLLGADGRYSNSQTQLATWFGVVAVAYFATLCLRVYALGLDYLGGVDAPQNLILLSGLSAFAFGGAKVISVNKGGAGPMAAAPPQPAPTGFGKGLARFVSDLTTSGGGGPGNPQTPDLGDFQMILITLVAAGIFIVTAYHRLELIVIADTMSLPDVDTSLLASFGLGQGAYLFKKAASPPGQG